MFDKSVKKWLAAAAMACALPVLAQTPQVNSAIFQYSGADREQRILEKAKQEGSVVVYTSLAPTEGKPLTELFESKYGVKVEMWRGLSDQVLQRTVSEARGRRNAVDVVETNGPEMESLAREQLLAEFHTPHLADLPPELIPGHKQWLPDRLNVFVVAYNTQKVKPEDLPKTYDGFADPKWKGRIALEAGDSEWMAAMVKTWGKERGMDFFQKLSAGKPSVRKGHILLAQMVSAGEVEVALAAYYANVASAKARGGPIDWAPVEPLVARPQGLGVVRSAPHPYAALLFANFMLSPQAQELLASMGRTPASRVAKNEFTGRQFVLAEPSVTLDQAEKWEKLWDKMFMNK
ncbi:MAG: extracellular solute-binding protein [Burkholderiaceae bacterium]|jgi:iron(III) transport system substrate-binding protein|nr:extracellular solute-binding protein [Burkholderiaceae bacterium]